MTQFYRPNLDKNMTAQPLALKNARIFDPESNTDTLGTLLIKDGLIADFGANIGSLPDGAEVVDCGGHLLTPGLLDIQVHFREPGQEYKETIETGTKAAVSGGVTTVCTMANTDPVVDDVTVVEFIRARMREYGYCRVHPYAAITKGLKGERLTEMALLKEAGAIGFSDDGKPVMNSLVMRRAMEYARDLNITISQHAEDIHLSDGGCMNEGPVSARLGVKGVPNASEAIIVERDILLNQLVGGHYHVLHISTWQALDAVRRAKKRGQNITCEVAPHHFTLTDEAIGEYDTNAKMNPPLRARHDLEAMIEGLKDGTIDAIATDHAPHDHDSKCLPLSSAPFGILGLETMLPLSLALYHQKHLSLRDVIGKLTYRAADILKLPAGRIRKGAAADLALIDLEANWTFSTEDVYSKSANTPFYGANLKGRVLRTVVDGKTVYAR